MILLRMMLKHPQFLKRTAWENGRPISAATVDEFFGLVKRANIVILDADVASRVMEEGRDASELEMSPPFPLMWIECLTQSGNLRPALFEKIDRDGYDSGHKIGPTGLIGALVRELSPGVFDVFGLELSGEAKDGHIHNPRSQVSVFRGLKLDSEHATTIGILRTWFEAIHNNTKCLELTDECVFIPRPDRPSKTKPHQIRQIVRIVPNRRRGATIAPLTPRGVIDWTHRWEVRGHWRKVDGIGKDREGQYSIAGFTWIKEHERGPDDAPLVKKTRIVSSAKIR